MAGQTINISVLADTAKFKSGLTEASSVADKFGKGLKGVGIAAGAMAAAGVVAVGALAVEAFKAVAEVERLTAQTSAAIASTGGAAGRSVEQITGLADSLERMSGVEAEVIQAGQNMLLTFTNIKGTNFDAATQSALDMSVAMGTDMTSAATLVGKALNDPIKGIGALSKVGVQLTADQKALVEQMVATGDVAGAQGVILGVLQEQFGGSAEAFGNTFLGTVEKVKNSFGAITEAFVVGFLPPVTAALNFVNDSLVALADSPTFQAITTKFSEFLAGIFDGSKPLDFSSMFSGLLDAAISGIEAASAWLASGGLSAMLTSALAMRQGFIDALIAVVPQIITALTTAIPAIVTALTQAVPQLVQGAVTLFQSIIQGLVIIVPQLLTAIIGMLPGLIESILGMIPMILEAAITLFTSLVNAIPEILPPLVTAIVEMLPMLVESVLSMLPDILKAAIELFTALVQSLPVILPLLIRAILDLLPSILKSVLEMLPELLSAAIELFTGIVTAIPKIIPDLIGAVLELLPEIVDTLLGMVPDLIDAGVDLIGGLVEGLWNAAGKVGDALLSIVKDAVGDFLSFLGIKSPSRLFMKYGKNTVQGLVKGLTQNGGLVDKAMSGLSARVSDGFETSLNVPAGYSRYGSSSGGGAVVTVNVNGGLATSAEVGRAVVEAISEHVRYGGSVSFA